MKIVISQPMFFPWVGMFEQVRLSDVFVHYDDVQLPQGRSFTNRVQIKTKDGIIWMTVPLKKDADSNLIKDALIARSEDWESKHLKTLEMNYAKAPFKTEMLGIVKDVYDKKFEKISDLNIYALESIARYFGLGDKPFPKSSDLGFTTSSSQKLLDVIQHFKGDTYITGLGALNYVDYSLFDNNNISFEFMMYNKEPYPQQYGDFTPFVSILDLIAYMGKEGVAKINSPSLYYKDYLQIHKTNA